MGKRREKKTSVEGVSPLPISWVTEYMPLVYGSVAHFFTKDSTRNYPPSFVLRTETKLTNGFDDLFDDPILQEAMQSLTKKQYSALYCSFKSELSTSEIAELMSTTVRAVQKLLQRALIKLREEYVSRFEEAKACGYPKCVEHNYKRILRFFEQYEIILTKNDPAA